MTAKSVGVIMLILGVFIAISGYLITNSQVNLELVSRDFYANMSTDLLFTALTVLVIDALNEKRAIQQEFRTKIIQEKQAENQRKQELILQMGSPDIGFAVEATRILKVQGWLMDGTLNGAILVGANLNKSNLEGASLQQVDLQKATLIDANLRNANLSSANLKNSNLKLADLYKANLSKVCLFNAILDDADLFGANLQGADLFDARLVGVDLRDADLTDAELYGADFTDADLSGAILIGIKYNERTRLPPSLMEQL